MRSKSSDQDGFANAQSHQRPRLGSTIVVLPSGQHVKREVTFNRNPPTEEEEASDSDEQNPLLDDEAPQPESRKEKIVSFFKRQVHATRDFLQSKTGKGVLKCSIAYVLGSMATFVPPIYKALGHQEGKHVVATITVYYHPARSIGSTFEALICSLCAMAYTAALSFSSMGISIFFGRTLDMIVVGHIIVLIVFCGGGLGFIGWVKQRMSHPVINISCSLAALALITVLTKEGAVQASSFSDDKVVQELEMVLMGIACTTIVSFLIFPVSARKELRSDFVKATDAFGDMLQVITQSFLSGHEDVPQQQTYKTAFETSRKVFTSMAKYTKEARYEHYFLGTEKQYFLEAKLVKCMQRLAQNIGGLRSAATTQFLLLKQPTVIADHSYSSHKVLTKRMSSYVSFDGAQLSSGARTPPVSIGTLGSHNNQSVPNDIRNHTEPNTELQSLADHTEGTLPPLSSPADIFTRFIIQLGPSMKSLAVTMIEILDELPFDKDGRFTPDNHFTFSLNEAIRLYNLSRQEALQILYRSKELSQSRSRELQADFEEVAASCGYFSFSLLDFANEMKTYLEILDDLKLEVEERPDGLTWSWLKFWRLLWPKRKHVSDSDSDSLMNANLETDLPGDVPSPIQRRATLASKVKTKTRLEALRYKLWRSLSFFRRDDVKFAVKVGVGAALYALPSYLASTRPFYQRWRGEWGLLSYILVCTMTLGASNTTGLARFVGTVIGAVCAIVSWTAAGGNPFLLAFFGWIMAYWTAYIIVGKGQGPFGRFIVLTYNLSALYAYSYSVKDVGDEDYGNILDPRITEITLHRTAAVISGCIWGLIITRLIWPISARQKLKEGLSLLWLRMGLIWRRDPLNMLIEGVSQNAYMDLGEEFDLQRFLSRLENLKGSAQSEIDIRGPFLLENYNAVLKATRAMLDAFHAMNVMIRKNPRASGAEAEILKYTANERDAICSRISHLFQVLASSMKLEFPMNGALPSIGHTRDRLLAKVFRFRQEEQEKAGATDEDFELLYAYALVTGQLAEEIRKIGHEIEQLFGVLNEDLLKLE